MRLLLAVFRAQVRYWLRHRLQSCLAVLGIALGVGVFTAVRLANAGALAAFAQGVEAFAGRATHRVYNPAGGSVPDALFPALASLPQVRAATPVLHGHVHSSVGALQVLGMDPISNQEFQNLTYIPTHESEGEDPQAGLDRFLRVPNAVTLPASLARALDVGVAGRFPVEIAGHPTDLRVAGIFQPPARKADLLDHTVVMDVSTFQELFGRMGQLDEIELILGKHGAGAVRKILSQNLSLEPIGARAERVDRMSQAFRLNLESLGLFALLVAAFLIYNTAMFSVVQREQSIAILRCIGARPQSIFVALILEAAVLGLVGGAMGILLGRWLAVTMICSTSATIFEVILDTSVLPAAVRLTVGTWAMGLMLGVLASVAGVSVPALEAARVSPLAALRGLRGSGNAKARLWLWTFAGVVLLVAAAVMLLTPSRSLLLGLVGATALVIGGALLSPAALSMASKVLSAPLNLIFGPAGLLAGRNLSRNVSRTGMATASLMVALSLALAIQITVNSFRETFGLWLKQAITADLYVAPAAEGHGNLFPQGLAGEIRKAPWARDVAELKSRRVVVNGREILVVAIHPDVFERTASLPMLDTAPTDAMASLRRGGAFVSETLAFPLGLKAGDTIPLPGQHGIERLSVAAIVQNYSVPTGLVYLDIHRFQQLFGQVPTQQVAVWLKSGFTAADARRQIEELPGGDAVRINPNKDLKKSALRIFDRTFAITRLMGALAAFVAVVAIVSALLALLEERMRILGYLRAIGVSRRCLGISLALEAALLATVAGIMSWGVGWLMSAVLVYIVNRRAFGWTLQFLPGQGSYAILLLLAIAAALFGSVYPIWRATRASVVSTIREE